MNPPKDADLIQRLDLLTNLLAVNLVHGKSQREQIRLLSVCGMGPAAIANLVGTTSNTVSVALSALRKAGKLNLKSEGGKEHDE